MTGSVMLHELLAHIDPELISCCGVPVKGAYFVPVGQNQLIQKHKSLSLGCCALENLVYGCLYGVRVFKTKLPPMAFASCRKLDGSEGYWFHFASFGLQ